MFAVPFETLHTGTHGMESYFTAELTFTQPCPCTGVPVLSVSSAPKNWRTKHSWDRSLNTPAVGSCYKEGYTPEDEDGPKKSRTFCPPGLQGHLKRCRHAPLTTSGPSLDDGRSRLKRKWTRECHFSADSCGAKFVMLTRFHVSGATSHWPKSTCAATLCDRQHGDNYVRVLMYTRVGLHVYIPSLEVPLPPRAPCIALLPT